VADDSTERALGPRCQSPAPWPTAPAIFRLLSAVPGAWRYRETLEPCRRFRKPPRSYRLQIAFGAISVNELRTNLFFRTRYSFRLPLALTQVTEVRLTGSNGRAAQGGSNEKASTSTGYYCQLLRAQPLVSLCGERPRFLW